MIQDEDFAVSVLLQEMCTKLIDELPDAKMFCRIEILKVASVKACNWELLQHIGYNTRTNKDMKRT